MVDFVKLREQNQKAALLRASPNPLKKIEEPSVGDLRTTPHIDIAFYLWDEADLNSWEKTFIPSIINWLRRDSLNKLSIKQAAKLMEMAKDYKLEDDVRDGYLRPGYAEGMELPVPVNAPPAYPRRSVMPPSSGDPRDAVQQNRAPKVDKFGFDDMDDDIPF